MDSSGAVWMIVKKAGSGWEASLPGGPALGTSTRQERRKQISEAADQESAVCHFVLFPPRRSAGDLWGRLSIKVLTGTGV